MLALSVGKLRYVVRSPGFHHEAGPSCRAARQSRPARTSSPPRLALVVEYSDVVCSKDDCRRAFRTLLKCRKSRPGQGSFPSPWRGPFGSDYRTAIGHWPAAVTFSTPVATARSMNWRRQRGSTRPMSHACCASRCLRLTSLRRSWMGGSPSDDDAGADETVSAGVGGAARSAARAEHKESTVGQEPV